MNEWISVKDRMPDEQNRGDNPLVVSNISDSSVFIAFYVDGQFAFGEYDFLNITHWMKIVPPKETT